MQYRKDIDGLRAIAVGSVILFHAGFHNQLPGGFFGVDIFFVISGFLIGRILFTEIAEERFHLLRFYERRARRILPALLVTLIISYGVARIFFTPVEFSDFKNSLLATLGFSSNIYFWLHSGYFEASSELKPLLHTWSLGVEEQYYIIFPLLVFSLRNSTWRLHVLVLCTILSFAWAVTTTPLYPNAGFYLLPARAWELLLGALGAIWVSSHTASIHTRNALSFIGLVMIAVSLTKLNASLPHPGWVTLLPTVGTILVLVAEAPSGVATRLLQLTPLIFIGQISYSAYLWHQPIFSFWIHRFGKHSLENYALLLIVVTGIFAYASWRFIENPARHSARTSSKRFFISAGCALALLATIFIPQSWLFSNRSNQALQDLVKIENLYEHFEFQKNIRNKVCHSVSMEDRERNGCLRKGEKNLVLFGDSYAASLYQGLRAAQDTKYSDYRIIQLTDGNAPPFFLDGQIDGGASLHSINEAKLKAITDIQPQKIVMSWMIFGKNSTNDPTKELAVLRESIARLRTVSPASDIFVIGPVPNWSVSLQKSLIDYLADNEHFPRYMQQGLTPQASQWDAFFNNQLHQRGSTYLSAQKVLCTANGCLTSVDGSVHGLTAVDWGHLTKAGSIYLIENIAPRIFE